MGEEEMLNEVKRLKEKHGNNHKDFLVEFINLLREEMGINEVSILRSAQQLLVEASGRKHNFPVYTMKTVTELASPTQPKLKPLNASH